MPAATYGMRKNAGEKRDRLIGGEEESADLGIFVFLSYKKCVMLRLVGFLTAFHELFVP